MVRVSVVMPCFNSARYMGEAIGSILGQGYRDLELLIVLDAGSKDETEKVLERFRGNRVRVVRNDPPLGLIRSLNRGFALASGEYIARMDSDDVATPERIEKQVRFLDDNPGVGVVGSAVRQIDEHGDDLGVRSYPITPALTLWKMHFDCAMCHPATMFRRSIFEESGGYSPGAVNSEDYELWLRVMRFHDLTNLPDVLLSYRLHHDSICAQRREEQRARMVETAGRAIEVTLARPVHREFVRSMLFPYTIETRKNAIGAAWLLTNIRRSYMMWYKARSREDTIQVKREVATKMSHILTRSMKVSPPGAPMILWQASRCGPGITVRLGDQMLRRAKDALTTAGPIEGGRPNGGSEMVT